MPNMTADARTPESLPSGTRLVQWKSFYHRLKKNKAALFGGYFLLLMILVAIFGPLLTQYDPTKVDYSTKLLKPSADHWFGTDHNGRDIFTRIIHGMRLTLSVGFISVIIGAAFGVVLGIISGYYGGKWDALIMRMTDVMLAFPGILLALAVVSVLGKNLFNVIIAVSIFSIPTFARVVRGSTLAVRKLEYIDAMRSLGASDGRIIFGHILPNITSPIIVQATLRIAVAILTASGLSFLGLGAQPPTPEWGAMLNDGRNYIMDHPHVALFPGLSIVFVVIAFNLLGDGLRDVLDPKMKK
ncbi:nickel transporter permease [Paenibacillus lautus]|uniref:ABC transporter permease subunit n=1 Tax=Paenibacillus lautus TaxID=1401 RepID=A0A385TTB1_PAELA|nr:nickel transporter permease [Paenibacillus lautus]AYB46823.1 ABC transporter permease subunit [Paenibacillus lautus]MBY0164527.1 ABC transporter permease subunit [Cytobacillus firmus]MCI1772717.1 ABC transporter permease subunit [Paenibacillus lautus]VTR33590.1 dipeptide transport system permease [Actinobacillus pleuropneumoniae]